MTVRWVFNDPAVPETYTVPLNPNSMTSPFREKAIDLAVTTAVDGQALVSEGQARPVNWQFSGTILTQAHYDALFKWYSKSKRFYLTDHYGRRFTVYFTDYKPIPKRSVGYPWRHDYTITAIVYGILAADGVTVLQGAP